jgi:hypothetical protein
MALNKSVDLDSGVTATYWKIVSFELNGFSTEAQIQLAGYLSKEAKDSGKSPLGSRAEMIPYDKSLASFSPFQQAYDNIKQNDPWSDAADI